MYRSYDYQLAFEYINSGEQYVINSILNYYGCLNDGYKGLNRIIGGIKVYFHASIFRLIDLQTNKQMFIIPLSAHNIYIHIYVYITQMQ